MVGGPQSLPISIEARREELCVRLWLQRARGLEVRGRSLGDGVVAGVESLGARVSKGFVGFRGLRT